jgi:hypothetical protein
MQYSALIYQKNPARLHKNNSLKYPLYSPTSLTNAYMEVKNHNMSVRKAARIILRLLAVVHILI